MSKIDASSRVLNQKVKTRCFFMDFQLMDNLNMTARIDTKPGYI